MILELIDMLVEQNLKLNWEEIINGARKNTCYDPYGLIGSSSIYKVYRRIDSKNEVKYKFEFRKRT